MQRLKVLHLREWVTAWNEAFDELSRAQTIFCACGKLSSWMHERSCTTFRKKVDDAAIKRLEHLIEYDTHTSNTIKKRQNENRLGKETI